MTKHFFRIPIFIMVAFIFILLFFIGTHYYLPFVSNSTLPIIRTATVTGTPSEIQALLIEKYGLDKNHGIDLVFFKTMPGDVEKDLHDGKYAIAPGSILEVYNQTAEKDQLKIVFPIQHFSYHILVPASSTIKTLIELRSKKIGVLHKTTAAYPATFIIFKSIGLEPEENLEFVYGSPDQIIADLSSGQVDAATVAYPLAAKLISSGHFRSLGKLEDTWKQHENDLPMPFVAMMARDSWLQTNKDTAIKIARTYYDAASLIQNDPSVIEELSDYLSENHLNNREILTLIKTNMPSLLFSSYGNKEQEGINRYFEKAKKYRFLPFNAPPPQTRLLSPSELGF